MLFAFAFSQALEMQVLPMLSMNGIYLAFIACFAFSLLFIHWVPERATDANPDCDAQPDGESEPGLADAPPVPTYIPWLCLAAIFFTYINIGSYWTYVELASIDAGIDNEYVGRVLVWGSLLTVVGCAVATVFSNYFGLARPLLVSLVAMASVVFLLSTGITEMKILLSIFGFNLLWIFIDVYQMSTVANIDQTGAFASLMPGAQGLGQIVGPNIAASLLGAGLGYSAVFKMCAAAAIVGMLIYGFMYLWLRRKIPALADAA
jgi:MFS family permease